ncbi:MAG: hypothetical protein B6227_02635 [Fusobacteriia bacterium 4572_74]|nr:MAG: hypothetical protein B6227_02635 [Fusobacteriia bacterium 4572_74]
MILNIILVAVGGSIGAISRYKIDKGISNITKYNMPFGTLGVNLLGLFIIGFSYRIFEHYMVTEELKHFIIVGFLGALTTFSSYALHTFQLFEKGRIKEGLLNIFLNNILGMLVALAGSELGRFL